MNKIKQLIAALRRPGVDLRDVLVFGGIGCMAYGAGLVYPPAGWLVAGGLTFWLGVR